MRFVWCFARRAYIVVVAAQASLDTLEGSRLDDISAKLRGAAEAIAVYERERRINPTYAAFFRASVV